MELRVDESKVTKRLVYKKDFFDRFGEIKFPLFGGLLALFLLIQLFMNFKIDDLKPAIIILVFLIITIYLELEAITGFSKIDDLIEIVTDKTDLENMAVCKEIANQSFWRLVTDKKEYLVFRNPSKILNAGENITILFDKNIILINSTCYPINDVHNRSPFSFGANKRNINKFRSTLEKIYVS